MEVILLCLVLMGAIGILLDGCGCVVGLVFLTAMCGLGNVLGYPWLGLFAGLVLLWFLQGFMRALLNRTAPPSVPPCSRSGCPYVPSPACRSRKR